MTYEAELETTASIMGEPEPLADWLFRTSLDLPIEERLGLLIRQLDELCAMATNEETVDLIERQKIAVGQICVRAQLLAAFLMARQPTQKMVRNNDRVHHA